ncbi:MAG: amidophosphoribosyltransferase, partial [Oscillibacter sp.]|nr:amidophosphoribosyltransferase [Oscillibacter sp.]
RGNQFMAMSSGRVNASEFVAALINERDDLVEGIRHAQDVIDGSMTVLLMLPDGCIIAARDQFGRLPVVIGKDADGYCVSFESFAATKLGYTIDGELGPAEIVRITADGCETLSPAGKDLKICAFLWTYYGYPNSNYEGVNVEVMRYRNGEIMARDEIMRGNLSKVDYVAGVPDSGIPHAIGYANRSGKPFSRPFVKYTPTWPRSFMPANQDVRDQVAKMTQIPVPELIEGKKLLFVDDSIVRGTQLQGTVDFLFESGAGEVHMRSACPPIMYACKYLNFSRSNSDMELLARRTVQCIEGDEGEKHLDEYADASTERGKCLLKSICESMGFHSLGYQSLDGLLEAIEIDKEKICTYCWTGKE